MADDVDCECDNVNAEIVCGREGNAADGEVADDWDDDSCDNEGECENKEEGDKSCNDDGNGR